MTGRMPHDGVTTPFAPVGPPVDEMDGSHRDEAGVARVPQFTRVCLMRAVRSWTRLYTDLSSEIRRVILDVAWITVVWSRPPNSFPIFGREASVSSRERYIATWRG